MTLLLAPLVASSSVSAEPSDYLPYDALKSRRGIKAGRPKPDAEPPTFAPSIPIFKIDDIEAQEIQPGSGDPISDEDLVVLRYIIRQDDGTNIDDSNLTLAAVFRPGAHQVLPGIEDAVIGMRRKGERRIRASAERIYSYVDHIQLNFLCSAEQHIRNIWSN